jgi:hypothetical protein
MLNKKIDIVESSLFIGKVVNYMEKLANETNITDEQLLELLPIIKCYSNKINKC